MNEFEIIDRYFMPKSSASDVSVGIGDDGAVIETRAGEETVLATDTLVESVHFPVGSSPRDIGHKCLAVNLSDLAAMGAVPRWALLNLTLPNADQDWLCQFSSGFLGLAERYAVTLVGGDTSHGPLCISVTVAGTLPAGTALTRSGACPGDQVWVSGSLGDAAIGLRIVQGEGGQSNPHKEWLIKRLNTPEPRVRLGRSLKNIASAAVDVSDGLLADLGHILRCSGGLGAVLDVSLLPLSPAALAVCEKQSAQSSALSGGDDYELCFTVPGESAGKLMALNEQQMTSIVMVGEVCAAEGIHLTGPGSGSLDPDEFGYRHSWPAET